MPEPKEVIACFNAGIWSGMISAEEIRNAILRMANERGEDQSFFASEVARRLDPANWRDVLGQVRFVASVLIKEGKIVACRSGEKIDSANERGPEQLRKVTSTG